MVSEMKFYTRLGAAVLILAIATFVIAVKLSAPNKADTTVMASQLTEMNQTIEVREKTDGWRWHGIFGELRFLIADQHAVGMKELEVKRMVGAGAVAIGIEELRELKEELAKKQESYNAKLVEAKAADPEGFKKYNENSKQWRETVNKAYLDNRFARTAAEMESTHSAYLQILYKTDIELP